MESATTLREAMSWFLRHSAGEIVCVGNDGEEQLIGSYPEAEQFFAEHGEVR